MILMQRDTRLWDYFCYFLTFLALMVLFLVVFVAIMMEMGFWMIIFGLFIFFILIREIVRNFVGMVRGLQVKFWIVKEK